MSAPSRFNLIALALLMAAASPAAAPTPTLAPERLQPGQKATVKTVFQGERIEEFEAEIVGVLKGGRAAGDMILARATSERVMRSGIAQGMSGSPVYVDGKLIGALSAGWSFSREPLFVVTPIGEMLQLLDLPATPVPAGTAGPSGVDPGRRSAEVRFGEFRWGDDAATAPSQGAGAAPAAAAPTPLALPVACGGMNPAALDAARQLLAPLGFVAVPGGRTTAEVPSRDLEPGAAVGVVLLKGDLDLSAIGTLTYRDGDRLLIFGHPLFQSGEVRLPLAAASITTIVASEMTSFKLGSSGPSVGVLTQDRRAGMAGHLGGAPRLMPVTVAIGGSTPHRAFRFETIEDRALSPQLVALAALNSLLESGGAGPNQTLRWTLRLHRPGAPALELSDVLASELPSADLIAALATPLRFLANNPFSTLALDSVAIRIDVEPGRELWTLRSALLLDAAVRPGGRARVRCEVERWRGIRETVMIELDVPRELPDGRYLVWVGGGAELARFEALRLPGRYRPASLDEAWRRLATYRPADRLYAALVASAPEVTRNGLDYPELPTSAMALLSSSQGAGDDARRGDRTILDETRLPLRGAVRGELQMEMDVDAKAP